MIEKKSNINDVRSVAKYSDCERYRYILTRVWNDNGERIMFIGLNPSTADEIKNDSTVTRMMNFSKKLGFGSITVCNLFAFRTTFPKYLKNEEDPIGIQNDELIKEEMNHVKFIVAAWGNHGKFLNRSTDVLKYLKDFHHFGLTKLNEPRHVLYLSNNADLKHKIIPF